MHSKSKFTMYGTFVALLLEQFRQGLSTFGNQLDKKIIPRKLYFINKDRLI